MRRMRVSTKEKQERIIMPGKEGFFEMRTFQRCTLVALGTNYQCTRLSGNQLFCAFQGKMRAFHRINF